MSKIKRYYLMHLDTEVLELSVDEETGIFVSIVEYLDLKHLPLNLYVDSDKKSYVDINGLNKWWLKRGIPERRDGLTPLMGYLRIQNRGRLQLMNNGLSLSDCYWIKRKGDPSKWDEVNFFVNTFSDDIGDIMFGGRNKPADKINIMSPDLSTNGWLKKTWKIDKGIRYLLKSGSFPNYQEPINEILATKLLESLNLIPYVPYSLGRIEKHTVSVCRNFIENGFEFVPASTIYKTTPRKKDETIYDHLMERCRHFGINNASDYVDRMLQVDFIMANTDRHLGNFGFIRNAQTLAFLGPAPLFDNGTSLWNQEFMSKFTVEMNISKPFDSLQVEQIKHVNKFHITPEMLSSVPELFDKVMDIKASLPASKRKQISKNLKENIDAFNEIVEKAPPEKQPDPATKQFNAEYLPYSKLSDEERKNTCLDDLIVGTRIDLKAKHVPSEKKKVEDNKKRSPKCR